MLEMNAIALKQLFAGEDLYLLESEYSKIEKPSVTVQKVAEIKPEFEEIKPNYYQPKSKVVILLKSLNPVDSELLGKILVAIKLDFQSIDLIELDKIGEVDLSQIVIQKSVNQLITFGITLSVVKLPISLNPYQFTEQQGIKLIYSDSLADLQNDIPKKKALWGALKGFLDKLPES
jgi:DNA polymerase III psi subunit